MQRTKTVTCADGTKLWPTLLLRYNDKIILPCWVCTGKDVDFVFSFFLHILMTQSAMVGRTLEVLKGVLIVVLEI